MAKPKQQRNKQRSKKHVQAPAASTDSDSLDVDIAAFIEEQQLEIDPDVAELLTEDTAVSKKKGGKKKGKKSAAAAEEDSKITAEVDTAQNVEGDSMGDVDMDEEDEAELAAYLDMMKGKKEDKDEEEDELVEKVYSNDTVALLSRLDDIRLDQPGFKVPWIETQSITSPAPLDLDPSDVHDDLKRELAFYKQALYAATEGRKRILAAGVPFSRPDDFFAEMVKTDEHMAKVRQRLLDEAASIQAAEQARKQRDLKKFGKKVQQEKLAERERTKKAELEKVKVARRKHASAEGGRDDGDDEFDVEVDSGSRGGKGGRGGKTAAGGKRKRKDEKFGFGGPKRHKKSNTADSTSDMSGFSLKKMKGKPGVSKNRPGKARRQASRGRK
ncbi:uncharacterized protein SPPG_03021 [Spizellomyces punctatus DAOM BR117]|uniref:Ebp2-domain-containing protein n=1 Tax=Spizellomyces punctatus (strain DAOM BR117) TaxID=645134 RepID=A0A0L0HP50_SPIPD|nr:uncharacterized protein SPPG_03021 [Spizellomyces punctatus DAOM BR117]KND02564.1 hypothetical protein SPPG_03021 [Spizellomyces punctatus DAOM BR117]|eukprot:XP_016610603.1 hypothetical protein SPPG_03021 [Spizellomyces punctatus DAOM BR117]